MRLCRHPRRRTKAWLATIRIDPITGLAAVNRLSHGSVPGERRSSFTLPSAPTAPTPKAATPFRMRSFYHPGKQQQCSQQACRQGQLVETVHARSFPYTLAATVCPEIHSPYKGGVLTNINNGIVNELSGGTAQGIPG